MTQRVLYIAAYDVSDPGRLRDALKVLKGYASGRQKSVFECFLTAAERRDLLLQIHGVLDQVEDRFILFGEPGTGRLHRRQAHRDRTAPPARTGGYA